MFRDLDPLLHSQVRLAIMTLLLNSKSAEFSFLLEKINTTKGNLSFQLKKLQNANYITIIKTFKNNYPLTTVRISEKGIDAYQKYIDNISDYFKQAANQDNS